VTKHDTDLQCAYLDMDQLVHPKLFTIWSVCRIIGVQPVWIESTRTRRGWHLRVYLDDRLTPAELVAFQAVCGSDRRREMLNLMRVLAIRRTPIRSRFWRARWNLLFAHKLR
jgi:hypothetical protein